jgi:hypothetical protein
MTKERKKGKAKGKTQKKEKKENLRDSEILRKSGAVPIVFADELDDCPDCGEKWCPKCSAHYADCDCPGPFNAEELGYRIVEDERGRLWAV